MHTTVGSAFRSCSRRLVFPSFVNPTNRRLVPLYHRVPSTLKGILPSSSSLFFLSLSLFIFFFGLRDLTKKTRNQKSRRAFCQSVPLCPSWVSVFSNGNFDPSICRNTARLGEKEKKKKTAEFCERRHGSNGNKKKNEVTCCTVAHGERCLTGERP